MALAFADCDSYPITTKPTRLVIVTWMRNGELPHDLKCFRGEDRTITPDRPSKLKLTTLERW